MEAQKREDFKLGESGTIGGSYPHAVLSSSINSNSNSSSNSNNASVTHPQRAELKLHKSGVITSVVITLAETTSARYCHEVNLRRVLQNYGITKDKERGYGKWAEVDARRQLEAAQTAQTAAVNAVATVGSGHEDPLDPDPLQSHANAAPLSPANIPNIPEIKRKRDNPYDNIIEKL